MPLAWLTFLVGTAYIPGLPSNAVVGRWCVWAAGVAIILWTIRIDPGRAHWLGLGLLGWIAAGFAWAVSGWDHAAGAAQWALMAATFCVGAEIHSLENVWRGLALAAWVSAAVALAQFAGYEPVWAIAADQAGGAAGLMLTKNMAGELAVVALIGALALRSIMLAIGPGLVLALAGSRASVLALGAAALFSLWVSIPREDRAFVALAAVGASVLAGIAGYMFGIFDHHLFFLADRWAIWSRIVPAINPWGDGLGSVAVAWPNYEFAHNEIIHYAFELGVGSVLIWGIVVHALGTEGHIAARTALVAFVAFALVWFPLHGPTSAFLVSLLAGQLCGVRHRAVRAQSRGRAYRSGGLPDAEPLGIGALQSADLGRLDLSARPQSAVGARELRRPLQRDRDEERP